MHILCTLCISIFHTLILYSHLYVIVLFDASALPCGPNHIANMDVAHVASTLSELNLMTYGENLIVLHVLTTQILTAYANKTAFGT